MANENTDTTSRSVDPKKSPNPDISDGNYGLADRLNPKTTNRKATNKNNKHTY